MASNTGEGSEVFCFSIYSLIAPLRKNASLLDFFSIKRKLFREKKWPFYCELLTEIRCSCLISRPEAAPFLMEEYGVLNATSLEASTHNQLQQTRKTPPRWCLLAVISFRHSRCAFLTPQINKRFKSSPSKPQKEVLFLKEDK